MWARTIEFMLACWLAASPFVFRYGAGESGLWGHDFGVAALIAGVALGAFHPRLKRLHLVNLASALWLIGFGYLAGGPAPSPGPYQNYIVLGLLLLMFPIVPTDASVPPEAWRGRWERREASLR